MSKTTLMVMVTSGRTPADGVGRAKARIDRAARVLAVRLERGAPLRVHPVCATHCPLRTLIAPVPIPLDSPIPPGQREKP